MPHDPAVPDLPPGLITLRRWAGKHGRTPDYVRIFWRARDGFPQPAGTLPARGRHGGGEGELLFEEATLNTWLAAQTDLQPPDRIDSSTLPAAGTRITLGRFAALIGKDRKTVTQHRDRPGFPEPAPDGTYRLGDLVGYWNNRTGRRGPRRRRSSASDEDPGARG
jgi:hypothetical protein